MLVIADGCLALQAGSTCTLSIAVPSLRIAAFASVDTSGHDDVCKLYIFALYKSEPHALRLLLCVSL